MLQGKVKAAVRWATERSNGAVLSPGDAVNSFSTTVLDILQQKHPDPSPPSPTSLLRSDQLP